MHCKCIFDWEIKNFAWVKFFIVLFRWNLMAREGFSLSAPFLGHSNVFYKNSDEETTVLYLATPNYWYPISTIVISYPAFSPSSKQGTIRLSSPNATNFEFLNCWNFSRNIFIKTIKGIASRRLNMKQNTNHLKRKQKKTKHFKHLSKQLPLIIYYVSIKSIVTILFSHKINSYFFFPVRLSSQKFPHLIDTVFLDVIEP